MKNKMAKIISALVVMAAFGLTGCLKDKDYDNGLIQSTNNSNGTNQNLVEIKLNASSSGNVLITAFNASNNDTTISNFVPVNLSSADPAPEDIHVTLKQNDQVVNDYDSANNADFQVPNASMFTVLNPGLVVTIPKGQHTGYLQVKLNPSNFVGADWALGYTIASIDNPKYVASGNLQNGMVGFSIKNKYDGHYKVTGTLVDIANGGITGHYPMDVNLVTQGGASVAMFDLYPSINGFAHSILSGGAISFYGSFSPVFTFDASDNITSVVNYYGQPSGNGRSGGLDDTGINKFNPSDHSIDVNYFMLQPSVISPYRTSFKEHFEYIGPR